MDTTIDLLELIKQSYSKMSKGQKAIADFIKAQNEEAVFMTAAKLGETVGVSESTVVRFASCIGFDGYPKFQEALKDWVKGKWNSIHKIGAKYADSSQLDVLKEVLTSDMKKIGETLQSLDSQAFETAIDVMLEAKHIYIVGIRSCEPLADFLSFYLQMIRGEITLLRTNSVSEMFEQMIRIDQNDLMIGISFPRYSMRTLKAMEFANDRNAKVIAITDSVHSPMNLYSSCNLFAKSDMVSIVDSLVAPLSLINALVVALCLKVPEQVKHNLKNLEEVWNNYQVYLNDEINFIDEEPIIQYSLKKDDKIE